MWDSSRVGFLDTTTNQSINGLLARLNAPFAPAQLPWVLPAGLALFAFPRRAALAGDELAGLTIAGVVGVLVSPVSGVHHIIWVFPAMLILTMRLVSSTAPSPTTTAGTHPPIGPMVRIASAIGYSGAMMAGLASHPDRVPPNVRDGDYDHGGHCWPSPAACSSLVGDRAGCAAV